MVALSREVKPRQCCTRSLQMTKSQQGVHEVDWKTGTGTGCLIWLVLVLSALVGGCSDSRRAQNQERQLAELAARLTTLAQDAVRAGEANLERMTGIEVSVKNLSQTTQEIAAQLPDLAARVTRLEGPATEVSQRVSDTEPAPTPPIEGVRTVGQSRGRRSCSSRRARRGDAGGRVSVAGGESD